MLKVKMTLIRLSGERVEYVKEFADENQMQKYLRLVDKKRKYKNVGFQILDN